ncbi:MFS transporter [Streptomyces benahoarensis]|uniref:MFS transporter n=1 Tax=Streptomyces benahoarensis TaxID=2595054 RepID=A0A553ZDS3_9ACTN|nr:MFS transporter [Streptomyces benahoarensis]TSB32578.1 MFS transporter [Streptomyces benahoarensis]TSB39578.1 MFS transporter [Streptomyces benahoarensis]
MRREAVALPALALGVFSIITTEMGIVGVLPEIADRLGVSASAAGLLVGSFALVVAVSGPFMTLASSAVDRRAVLAVTMGVFAVSNAVYALSTDFGLTLAFRVIPALLHPVFFSVALATAVRLGETAEPARATARVFAGVTVGFAFGVPLTSYLAGHFSLPAAFWFGAAVNLLGLVGLVRFLPAMPVGERLSYGAQLGVLRRGRTWLTLVSVVLVFAALFSVYGYFAAYLGGVSGMNGSWISAMLLVFGVVMIFGNFAFAALLRRGVGRTALAFPVLCLAVFAALFALGARLPAVVALVPVWAMVHSGGLIVCQSWLGRDTRQAPEFGNSLFVSFSNLGITVGTTVGGWSLAALGTRALPWTGIAFALAALVTVVLRLAWGERTGAAPERGTGSVRIGEESVPVGEVIP